MSHNVSPTFNISASSLQFCC